MRVRVRVFGGIREALGWREVERDIEGGATARQLMQDLKEEYPAFGYYAPVIKIAVNHEYVDPETVLCDGDEVAWIPPVAGG